ncbi:unnamed protein product [Merluccius merluccius]
MIRIKNPQPCHLRRHAGSPCDVMFSVEGQSFCAHRLVLAGASPALAPGLLRDGPLHYTLDLCSPRTFQQVLDFSYGRAVVLPRGELGALRSAAARLGMRLLEELLDGLEYRAMEMRRAPEEIEGSPAPDETTQRNLSPEEEEEQTSCPPTAPPHHSDTPQGQTSAPPSKKRVLTPSAPSTRDSVIRASAPCPAWASASYWPHMALRLMAQRYSNLVAVHPPPPPPHLGPHGEDRSPRTPVLHSVDWSPVRPQGLSGGSPDLEEIVRQDRRTRKSPVDKTTAAAAGSGEKRPITELLSNRSTVSRKQRLRHCGTSGLTVQVHLTSILSSSGEADCRYGTAGGGLNPPQQPPGAKPHLCQRCPKRFSLKHQLETHHRVHTGEKPFECRLCGQRSRDYSAMIKHLRTHGGAAPYQCTACRDFCSSLVAMQRHVKKHSEQDFPPDWTISWTYLPQHNMGYSENCKDLQTRWSQILKKCIPCEMKKIRPGYEFTPNCGLTDYSGPRAPPLQPCPPHSFNNGSRGTCTPCAACPESVERPCSPEADTRCCGDG